MTTRHLWRSMVAMTALLTLLAYCAVSMDVMRASYVRLWGPETVSKFDTWQGLIATLVNTDDSNRIRKVNDFFNRKVLFADSIDIWHDKDYWPTDRKSVV